MSDQAVKKKYVDSAEDLSVFQRAYSLALELHKASLVFPKIEQYALADQLRRSSKSICANIAEGFGKQTYSPPEFARFLAMAEGSAAETRMWVKFSRDLEYIAEPDTNRWLEDCLAIKSMLFNLRKNIK